MKDLLKWEKTYPYEERAKMFPSELADWIEKHEFEFEYQLGPFKMKDEEDSVMFVYATEDSKYVYTCNYIHENEPMELYHAYMVRHLKDPHSSSK